MSEAIVLDSVGFWNLASERHIEPSKIHLIKDISMVPLRGDCVSFEGDPEEYEVVSRKFTFDRRICHIMVGVQPVSRGEQRQT